MKKIIYYSGFALCARCGHQWSYHDDPNSTPAIPCRNQRCKCPGFLPTDDQLKIMKDSREYDIKRIKEHLKTFEAVAELKKMPCCECGDDFIADLQDPECETVWCPRCRLLPCNKPYARAR